MKVVMISINPKWVEKIASGEKTIEVRKTRPKMDTPFKCYIYCTRGENLWLTQTGVKSKTELAGYLMNGKVIGHFVCDRIGEFFSPQSPLVITDTEDLFKKACLKREDTIKYIGEGKMGYAWHISDLVIYDEPRELGEFWAYNAELNKLFNEGEDYCAWGRCETENGCTNDCDTENILHCYQCWEDWSGWCHRLTRPPESWCYVEEKEQRDEQRRND